MQQSFTENCITANGEHGHLYMYYQSSKPNRHGGIMVSKSRRNCFIFFLQNNFTTIFCYVFNIRLVLNLVNGENMTNC